MAKLYRMVAPGPVRKGLVSIGAVALSSGSRFYLEHGFTLLLYLVCLRECTSAASGKNSSASGCPILKHARSIKARLNRGLPVATRQRYPVE